MPGPRTRPSTWGLLAGAVGSEVSATLALRAASDRPSWYALVVVGYVAAFVLLAAVLRRGTAIGVAYGLWAASGVTLTALAGALLFAEPLTPLMLLGIALIIGGVLLVELGSRHPGDAPAEPSGESS
ncbi:DMT family transporter [Kineococcus rhizosphaerae]|uniref:Small multidrug resistance pump n=1 Tax=Kineococcus rhizosphaerae TaxID=559628 RepID=A0A2T0R1S5_9ACTN|nr:SMR family transporter [Kineococcus rhizosphaerae]PRY13471.1 small multidrug resistance pump [Kineococcus rhizosphaerae]